MRKLLIRKEVLALGLLAMFLLTMPVSYAIKIVNPPGGGGNGFAFSPLCISNDAGFAYNLTNITFVTTLLNLSGTYEYNTTQGGEQLAEYYIALGQLAKVGPFGAYYIQPVILFLTNGQGWTLEWQVQAWGDNGGYSCLEYDAYNFIAFGGGAFGGNGSSVNLNYLFNLSIKATLTNGQITSAWVYIENAKSGQVYFSKTVNLQYPIPDGKVFFEVEDPLNGTTPFNFPVIPTSNYVFVQASASNSTASFYGLPLYNGVIYYMTPPKANGNALPMFSDVGTQGVEYYW